VVVESEPGLERLQHRTMVDQVADTLRRMILRHELQSGQRVTQAELSNMLGVSTMPVREALLRLANEGMVIAYANRAFQVVNTTESSIRDLYWAHSVIAGELAARAWDHRTDELIAAMKKYHTSYVTAEREGRRDQLFEINWRFHAVINQAADSPALLRLMKNTLNYFPDFVYEVEGWLDLAKRWQADLIRQFTKGDRDSARAAAVANVEEAADLFVAFFWSTELKRRR
jgi:DNA-binding GntR family transcriptional regulator